MTDHHNAAARPAGPAMPHRRTVLTGATAIALIGAGAVLTAPSAVALTAPTIHSTVQWGARPVSHPVVATRPVGLVIHHMASPNTGDVTLAHAQALARSCQRDHMDNNGWADSGQHFTVSRGGYIMEGRTGSLAALRGGRGYVMGAHAGAGNNEGLLGIECEGTYTNALPPAALYRTLVHLCAYICQQYGISPARITGHQDHVVRECPGKAFYPHLATLRSDVQRTLETGSLVVTPFSGGPSAPSGTYPTLRQGDTGTAVEKLQRALSAAGCTVTVDGKFGPATAATVRSFQQRIRTGVDGVVGPKTWGALMTAPASGVTLRSGSSGTQVRHLQNGLNATLGLSLAEDGRFGVATLAGVRKYQATRGLAADGVVGSATWAALKGGR